MHPTPSPRRFARGLWLPGLVLLLATAPSVRGHVLEGPEVIQAGPDGSFAYSIRFLAESGGQHFGYYELCGQEDCGGFNTTVWEIADGFCEFPIEEGWELEIPVNGALVALEDPGRVRFTLDLCSENLGLSTDILSWTVSVPEESPAISAPLHLSLMGPNPVRRRISCRLELERSARVVVNLVHVTGAVVDGFVAQDLSAGVHELSWDLRTLPTSLGSGVYWLTAEALGTVQARSVVILR